MKDHTGEERDYTILTLDTMDSFGNSKNTIVARALCQFFDLHLKTSEASTRIRGQSQHAKNVPQQENSYDCGVLMLEYAAQFTKDPRGFVARATQEDGRLQDEECVTRTKIFDHFWMRMNQKEVAGDIAVGCYTDGLEEILTMFELENTAKMGLLAFFSKGPMFEMGLMESRLLEHLHDDNTNLDTILPQMPTLDPLSTEEGK